MMLLYGHLRELEYFLSQLFVCFWSSWLEISYKGKQVNPKQQDPKILKW